jgi:CheY-like chemotaxis protein
MACALLHEAKGLEAARADRAPRRRTRGLPISTLFGVHVAEVASMRDANPILLVEDDVVDVKTVERAFRELGIAAPLVHRASGEDALEWLRALPDAADRLPAVILLDLNMPRMNGLEFLRIVKSDPALKRIPVIVLTTSQEESDRAASFELGAAGYVRKPVDFEKFVDAMRIVNRYWTLSELP